jgi:putative FmdB family regulatory protein
MPLYVYECDACEIVLEELHAPGRAPEFVECPVCHGLCARGVSAPAPQPKPAPDLPLRYGRVPAGFHGDGCACCAPRRRR